MIKKKLWTIIMVFTLMTVFCTKPAYAFTSSHATNSEPWYGVSLDDGVRIRATTSTDSSSNILGQIYYNDGVQIISSGFTDWYKVKYTNEFGSVEIGFIYKSLVDPAYKTYGSVREIYGCELRSNAGSQYSVMITAPYEEALPYSHMRTVSQDKWAECVYGTTEGWVETSQNYGFRYE